MRHSPSKALPLALAAALALTACEQAGPTAPPVAAGAALRLAQGPAQPPGARSYTTVYRYDVDGSVGFNECTGEDVQFTGTVHGVLHLSPNGDGSYRLVATTNAAGVKGVGLTTGVRYVGVGNENYSTHLVPGSEATVVGTYRVIGRGAADDYFVMGVSRVRLELDGTLTALRQRLSIGCR
jgi:hypothetical protein